MSNKIIEFQAQDFFKDGEPFYIQKYIADSRYSCEMHTHDFIELSYIISGRALHYIGDAVYEAQAGDLVIVNYGVKHTFVPLNDTEERFSTYDLLFTPKFFDSAEIGSSDFYELASSYLFYSVLPENQIRDYMLNLIRPEADIFNELFSKIYNEFTIKQSGFVSMIRAYLIELITLIFREIGSKSSVPDKKMNAVEKAIEYMKRHYNTRINLDNIVADLFLSKDYFRQLFKKSTGTSITDYIQKVRVDEACRLLRCSDATVSEISECCGFNDIKFFYKTFKKLTGKTPNEFRKEKEGTEIDNNSNG